MKNIEVIQKQRAYFKAFHTLSYQVRYNTLKQLKEVIIKNEQALLDALQKDLGKSHNEGYMTEVGIVLKEITYMMKHVKKLMKHKKVRTSITDYPASSYVKPHPFGNVLIISPWNYPVNLTLSPLVGAIAAGNTAIIKPSEYSVHTSKILEEMINKTFPVEYIHVINGDVTVNQELLNHKFDFIFFTGSTEVGKIVMEKASKHLTPVCLELGGKSPVIVDKDVSLKVAAKRIMFGKFLNAGQTCIAPDYMYVHKDIKEDLVLEMISVIKEYYGDNPLQNEQYGNIINKRHFERIKGYLKDGTVSYGGTYDDETLKIHPTLLDITNVDTSIMKEEIFGPLLPIVTYSDIDEVITTINNNPSPLALYLFTNNKQIEKKVLSHCQFGGGCVNDTILHIASDYLPFGGVGESGMGNYHGQSSFKTFSHYKSILNKSTLIDQPIRYAPFTNAKNKLVRMFLK